MVSAPKIIPGTLGTLALRTLLEAWTITSFEGQSPLPFSIYDEGMTRHGNPSCFKISRRRGDCDARRIIPLNRLFFMKFPNHSATGRDTTRPCPLKIKTADSS